MLAKDTSSKPPSYFAAMFEVAFQMSRHVAWVLFLRTYDRLTVPAVELEDIITRYKWQ